MDVKPGAWTEAGIRLANAAGQEVIVGVTREPLEVFVDRRRPRLPTQAFDRLELLPSVGAGPKCAFSPSTARAIAFTGTSTHVRWRPRSREMS